jgi:hypothetical protein
MNLSYEIYNALIPASTSRPQLIEQSRIIRDGKAVFSSEATTVDFQSQSDPHRIRTSAEIQLPLDLEPGDYILQILVTDSSDKQKPRITSQWIDFEVAK